MCFALHRHFAHWRSAVPLQCTSSSPMSRMCSLDQDSLRCVQEPALPPSLQQGSSATAADAYATGPAALPSRRASVNTQGLASQQSLGAQALLQSHALHWHRHSLLAQAFDTSCWRFTSCPSLSSHFCHSACIVTAVITNGHSCLQSQRTVIEYINLLFTASCSVRIVNAHVICIMACIASAMYCADFAAATAAFPACMLATSSGTLAAEGCTAALCLAHGGHLLLRQCITASTACRCEPWQRQGFTPAQAPAPTPGSPACHRACPFSLAHC